MHPRFKKRHKDSLAQQVEHIPFKDGVLGSSPKWITEEKKGFPTGFYAKVLKESEIFIFQALFRFQIITYQI